MQARPATKAYWASVVLALLGLADATYLTILKFTHHEAMCAGVGDCYTVNTSPYAEIHGVPIALLGALAYLAILALLWLERRHPLAEAYGTLAEFGLIFAGVLYSAYLTYLEAEVIHAFCPYCVVSATILLFLLVLAIIRLLNEAPPQ